MPGSLYSDLAKIYEKAVPLPNGGSITIIAVTTLSGGDITHAIQMCIRDRSYCAVSASNCRRKSCAVSFAFFTSERRADSLLLKMCIRDRWSAAASNTWARPT